MTGVVWDELSEKRRLKLTKKMAKFSKPFARIDYTNAREHH